MKIKIFIGAVIVLSSYLGFQNYFLKDNTNQLETKISSLEIEATEQRLRADSITREYYSIKNFLEDQNAKLVENGIPLY